MNAPNTSNPLEMLRQAAEQGDPKAQSDLGLRHFQGDGVPRKTASGSATNEAKALNKT
jgi:TPR repeat protein